MEEAKIEEEQKWNKTYDPDRPPCVPIGKVFWTRSADGHDAKYIYNCVTPHWHDETTEEEIIEQIILILKTVYRMCKEDKV